jgi:hypothetical protein
MTSPELPESAEMLEDAREELARRMEEACQTGLVGGLPETTGELLKLGDALNAAQKATTEMIAARKAAHDLATARRESPGRVSTGDAEVAIEHGHERIREFRDSAGEDWRVWAVTPGMASPTSAKHLGDLRDGWLAFEALSGSSRRRLAAYPQNWNDLSDRELEQLLQRAAVAPIRKRPDAGA